MVENAGVSDEARLVAEARGGDLAAFGALVRMHEEKVIRVACSFVGNFEDARDIAQEAFVKAHDGLKKFKAESKFSTWIYRITANQAKDFLRKKKVRFSIQVPLQTTEENEPDPIEQAPSHAPGPLEGLLGRELAAAIQKAALQLPDQQRSAFLLRYMEGLSLEEIAETLDLSVGAVKAHLWQAGQKMKKSLAGFRAESGRP